jgi:hypothetical protein
MEMYDLQSKFNSFYGNHVVLPKDEKNNLLNKKNINIDRLKDGLKDYNEKHGTDYKLAEEPVIQGSVAMSTVTQNESNDYDIDVAIIFEKDNLPDGTRSTKNMIVNALKEKCKQFNTEPEALTNCVRIVYADGYHIDFAIYRRSKKEDTYDQYVYEHCGSEWRERDPRSITRWFLEQNKEHDYRLREVVRLLKMFCKSRSGWVNMPGGLIQSALADEQYQSYDRIDERFYYTVKAIRDRLDDDKEVYNPSDQEKSLKLVSKDSVKMDNLYTRLNGKFDKLYVLFNENCTYNQAIEAWKEFFNHDYWTEQKQEEKSKVAKSYASLQESEEILNYKESEEFIQYLLPVQLRYEVDLDCKVSRNGNIIGWLQSMSRRREILLPGCELKFIASTTAPAPYDVYWKVKNRGEVAKKNDCIRGQIIQSNQLTHEESTSFKGDHYVECYIVKNGICVAKRRINVQIKV